MTSAFSVRDRLFLLAHDDFRGFRPYLHQPTLAVGLAGAALVDLMMAERIHLHGQHALISDPYDTRPAPDPIGDHTLATIRPPYDPRTGMPQLKDLILALASDMYQRTQGLLVAAGVLTRVRRRLGRVHHQPTDPAIVTRIRGGPRTAVQGTAETSTIQIDALCALLRVLHLHDTLYLGTTQETEARLRHITARLRRNAHGHAAGIPAVIEAVDAGVGDLTVATYR
ncbi:MAG: GPP34 family phosphoprotein [Micromonosporaceae bacterium]|nr:GPP34 family phosphoprotein [Micromonosporaceae bacterium]